MAKNSCARSCILHRLAQTEIVNGEALSEELGVSRAAVWKQIELLRVDGYEIASSKRGYSLITAPGDLHPGALWRRLKTRWVGQSMDFYNSLVSTNITACDNAREGAAHGHVVLALSQSGGLGRLGRAWVSPPGSGVYLSVVLRPLIPPALMSRLTMLCALAAVYALGDLGIDAMIKWPNDIVVNKRKVCGILLQMSANMDTVDWVVAGLGMNFAAPDIEELRETATGINDEAGHAIGQDDYIVALLTHMERLYDNGTAEGFSNLYSAYREKVVNIGRCVRVLTPQREWEGYAEDIDDAGALYVRDDKNELHRLLAGDVSVRGLMGYTD